MQKLLKREEAAEALRISLKTFDRLVAKGAIKVRKIGGSVRIEQAALDEVGR